MTGNINTTTAEINKIYTQSGFAHSAEFQDCD